MTLHVPGGKIAKALTTGVCLDAGGRLMDEAVVRSARGRLS